MSDANVLPKISDLVFKQVAGIQPEPSPIDLDCELTLIDIAAKRQYLEQSQKQIAADLHCTRGEVCKALKKIKELESSADGEQFCQQVQAFYYEYYA